MRWPADPTSLTCICRAIFCRKPRYCFFEETCSAWLRTCLSYPVRQGLPQSTPREINSLGKAAHPPSAIFDLGPRTGRKPSSANTQVMLSMGPRCLWSLFGHDIEARHRSCIEGRGTQGLSNIVARFPLVNIGAIVALPRSSPSKNIPPEHIGALGAARESKASILGAGHGLDNQRSRRCRLKKKRNMWG